MSTARRESRPLEITALRGAAIGLVSGFKGGAAVGAPGAMLLMLATTAGTGQWRIILFSAILSLTTGLMAGALLGAVLGAVTGWTFSAVRRVRPDLRPWPLWLLACGGGGAAMGWLFAPGGWAGGVAIGAALGLLASWLAGRDFDRVVALQGEAG